MLPEEKARVKIDEQLTSVGWEVVTRFEYNRKNSSAVVEASMSGRKESDYLEFIKKDKLRLAPVKIQQKNFLGNVISDADYKFLKNCLKRDKNWEWYFVVRYLAATGARVSELIQIKVEHVFNGYFDLYSKGGKLRRLYIPKKLKIETENGNNCFIMNSIHI